MIFEKPLLDSREVTVGGQTLTVYEFTADVYFNELLEEADIATHSGQTHDDEITPADTLRNIVNNNARKQRFIAAALLPGYPDLSFNSELDSIKKSVSTKQINALYAEVEALNFPAQDTQDPKPATQAAPLSTDSPTT